MNSTARRRAFLLLHLWLLFVAVATAHQHARKHAVDETAEDDDHAPDSEALNPWYYVRQAGVVLFATASLLYVFLALAITCEDYLVPCIESVCAKGKIPDEAAGALLLAFGSSAPEIMMNATATLEGKTDLSLPAVLGSAMFAFGMIPAICALISGVNGGLALSPWPIIRDTVCYAGALALLCAILAKPSVGTGDALLLCSVYGAYMLVVLVPFLVTRYKGTFYKAGSRDESGQPVLQRLSRKSSSNTDVFFDSAARQRRTSSGHSLPPPSKDGGGTPRMCAVPPSPGSRLARAVGKKVAANRDDENAPEEIAVAVTDLDTLIDSGGDGGDGGKGGDGDGGSGGGPDVEMGNLKACLTGTASSRANKGGKEENNRTADTDAELEEVAAAMAAAVQPIRVTFEESRSTSRSPQRRPSGKDKRRPKSLAQYDPLSPDTVAPPGHGRFSGSSGIGGGDDDGHANSGDDAAAGGDGGGSGGGKHVHGQWEDDHDERSLVALLGRPVVLVMDLTFPDMDGWIEELPWWRIVVGFIMSLVWVGVFSNLSLLCTSTLATELRVPNALAGATLLALGSQVPDTIASVSMSKAGMADGAISNAIGSQVINVSIGIGLPFLLYNFLRDAPVPLGDGNAGALLLGICTVAVMAMYICATLPVGRWLRERRLSAGISQVAAGALLVGFVACYLVFCIRGSQIDF